LAGDVLGRPTMGKERGVLCAIQVDSFAWPGHSRTGLRSRVNATKPSATVGRSVGRGQRQLDRPAGWEQPGEGHVLWPASDDRRWHDGDAVPGGGQADHGVQVDGFLRYPRWACVIAT
jgi:hypothetical protein